MSTRLSIRQPKSNICFEWNRQIVEVINSPLPAGLLSVLYGVEKVRLNRQDAEGDPSKGMVALTPVSEINHKLALHDILDRQGVEDRSSPLSPQSESLPCLMSPIGVDCHAITSVVE